MRRSCARIVSIALLVSGVGLALARGRHHPQPPPDPPDPPRIAAFALNCLVPTLPDAHTRATLVGKITLQERTVYPVAQCADGPSQSEWPEFQTSDGDVLSLEVGVTVVLEDSDGQPLAVNHCFIHSDKGFFTARCAADGQGGEVDVLVSIAAP